LAEKQKTEGEWSVETHLSFFYRWLVKRCDYSGSFNWMKSGISLELSTALATWNISCAISSFFF